MANPRKFSEKIALHNQKQAEETAAFEKIMREVSVATNVKVGFIYNWQNGHSPSYPNQNYYSVYVVDPYDFYSNLSYGSPFDYVCTHVHV